MNPHRWREGYESDADRRRERRRSSEGERFDFDPDRERGRRRRDDDDLFDAPGGFAERDRWDLYEEWQQPRRITGEHEGRRFGSQGGFSQRERWDRPQEWERGQRYPAPDFENELRFGARGQQRFADRGTQGFGYGDRGSERPRDRSFAGRGPKGYQRSDARIQEDICDRLTADPYVDASEIRVEVRGGEVTLEGTVPDRSMKRAAEDCIEDVPGVTQVHNRLRIGQQGEGAGQDFSWARAGSDPLRGEQPRAAEQQHAERPESSQSRTGRTT